MVMAAAASPTLAEASLKALALGVMFLSPLVTDTVDTEFIVPVIFINVLHIFMFQNM